MILRFAQATKSWRPFALEFTQGSLGRVSSPSCGGGLRRGSRRPARQESAGAFANPVGLRKRHLQPKTALSRFPPVHRVDLEGKQRVDSGVLGQSPQALRRVAAAERAKHVRMAET
jgi:hypothetical protein